MTAIDDVIAERKRQVEVEGWSAEHDDAHSEGELAAAAACYAEGKLRQCWPWDGKWWKPKDARRNLVRAAALIVAEIERLDRAAHRPHGEELPAFKPCVIFNEELRLTEMILEDTMTVWHPWGPYKGHAVDCGYAADGRLVGIKIWDDVHKLADRPHGEEK